MSKSGVSLDLQPMIALFSSLSSHEKWHLSKDCARHEPKLIYCCSSAISETLVNGDLKPLDLFRMAEALVGSNEHLWR